MWVALLPVQLRMLQLALQQRLQAITPHTVTSCLKTQCLVKHS
jgi:hypothetical protein